MLVIEWLGTAGFRITSGFTSILIDPYVSRNPRARPQQPLRPNDLRGDSPIFLTHGHFDHAGDVAQIVAHTEAPVYGSATAMAPILRAGVPPSQLHATRPDETVELASVRARAFGSRHIRFDLPMSWRALRRVGWDALQVINLALRYPAGEVLSWRFEMGGLTIHHLGSGGSTQGELDLLAGSRPDILLVPLQGHSKIHEIALRYVELMQPQVVIPHHHDDFYPPISELISLDPFLDQMRRLYPDVRAISPVINQSMVF